MTLLFLFPNAGTHEATMLGQMAPVKFALLCDEYPLCTS